MKHCIVCGKEKKSNNGNLCRECWYKKDSNDKRGVVLVHKENCDCCICKEKKNKLKISKEFLYQKYIIENKTIKEIATILKCCGTTVWGRLKEFNIKIKPSGWEGVWNKGLDKNDPRVVAKCKKQGLTLKNRIKNDLQLKDKYLNLLHKANKYFGRKKNKIETKIESLLPRDYKYVGDGKVFIERFNPDFININGQKKIIEVYGDYWHNLPNYKIRDKKRLETYNEYGYKTLIIWQKELKNLDILKEKIRHFVHY